MSFRKKNDACAFFFLGEWLGFVSDSRVYSGLFGYKTKADVKSATFSLIDP